jgi:hypothetical protein
MLSLEQEVNEYLTWGHYDFINNCNSGNLLDFSIKMSSNRHFHLEVKEKCQRTAVKNWPTVETPEEFIFILDELTARRMIRLSPYSGLLVRNNMTGKYYFIDVVSLWLMPRVRVNRPLKDDYSQVKGKWMLDVRNFVPCSSPEIVMRSLSEYLGSQTRIFNDITACLGHFCNESVGYGGEVRTKEQRTHDYASTR